MRGILTGRPARPEPAAHVPLLRSCDNLGPMRSAFAVFCFLSALHLAAPAQKRLVLIDQDGSGPADSNQLAMIALLQSPVEVLGITIVTGNAWRDEEVQHTLS